MNHLFLGDSGFYLFFFFFFFKWQYAPVSKLYKGMPLFRYLITSKSSFN